MMKKTGEKIEQLFLKQSDKTHIQLLRYTFVGAFAFSIDYGLLYIFTEFANFHYLLSAAFSFSCGLIVNYFLSILWIFTTHKFINKRLEFLFFAMIGIIGLGMNEIFIWFFTEKISFHYMISKLFSTFFVYLWNFFARKYLLFGSFTK